MVARRQTHPDLANAALADPARFRELLSQFSTRQSNAKRQAAEELNRDNLDPYSIEAQKRIEEAIRQEAVLENMETAMENMPESFVPSLAVYQLYCITLTRETGTTKQIR